MARFLPKGSFLAALHNVQTATVLEFELSFLLMIDKQTNSYTQHTSRDSQNPIYTYVLQTVVRVRSKFPYSKTIIRDKAAACAHKCVVVVAAHCLPIASSRASKRQKRSRSLALTCSASLICAFLLLLRCVVGKNCETSDNHGSPPLRSTPRVSHPFPLIVNWFVTIILGGAFDLSTCCLFGS